MRCWQRAWRPTGLQAAGARGQLVRGKPPCKRAGQHRHGSKDAVVRTNACSPPLQERAAASTRRPRQALRGSCLSGLGAAAAAWQA
jgi:hypothetical protein